jgi:putative glycosyltransferase (TIGR04372 family)
MKKKYLLNKFFSSQLFCKVIFFLLINIIPIRILVFILHRDLKKNSKDIHTNFKKKTKVIDFWLKINNFFDDIDEFHQIKKKTFFIRNFDNFKKLDNNSQEIKFLIYNFFIFLKKISIVYPLSANILFLNYFNISKYIDYKIYFKNNKNDFDYQLSSYLLKNFYLRNMTHCFFIKNKKKFILQYLKKFSSLYCLNLLQVTVEYNIADAKLLKKVCSLINKKITNKKLNIEMGYGLDFYAFGHQLIFIDFFHRMKILNNFKIEKKIVMSPHFISNICVSKYIHKKYVNISKINDNLFFKELSQNKFEQKGADASIYGNTPSLYSLTYKEYKKFGNITPSIDKRLLKKVFNENQFQKLAINKKYICLFHRDALFKKENFKINSLNEDRTVDISNYKNVINFFCELGYKVVLMGSSSQKKITLSNKNFINYAHSKFKNDYNDIYLAMNCDFFLNFGQSGFINFSHCFNKFSLNLEFPFNRKPFFHDKCFYALRPLYLNGKLMKFKDYFNNILFQVHDFEILKKKGYSLDITPEKELIKICEKFINVKNKKNYEKHKIFSQKGKIDYFFNIIQ